MPGPNSIEDFKIKRTRKWKEMETKDKRCEQRNISFNVVSKEEEFKNKIETTIK